MEEPSRRDRCRQNEVITLGETAVTRDMSRRARESGLVLSRGFRPEGWRPAAHQSSLSIQTRPSWLHREL